MELPLEFSLRYRPLDSEEVKKLNRLGYAICFAESCYDVMRIQEEMKKIEAPIISIVLADGDVYGIRFGRVFIQIEKIQDMLNFEDGKQLLKWANDTCKILDPRKEIRLE